MEQELFLQELVRQTFKGFRGNKFMWYGRQETVTEALDFYLADHDINISGLRLANDGTIEVYISYAFNTSFEYIENVMKGVTGVKFIKAFDRGYNEPHLEANDTWMKTKIREVMAEIESLPDDVELRIEDV